MNAIESETRARGALYGAAIGDALAMPVHWYYDRAALRRDYVLVDGFRKPHNPHPGSILWRSHYEPLTEKGEILHDQAVWWGQRDIHYHQFLEAGENTLTWQLANEAMESLAACGGYDRDDYLKRYVRFLTTPGRHRDTYLEECHRGFFTNFARGVPLHRCAVKEKHIGGLARVVPVVVWFRGDRESAVARSREHVALTHGGERMAEAVTVVADLFWRTLAGERLRELILEAQRGQASEFSRHPFDTWLAEPDEKVVGSRLSTACYLEDSVPATLYLALKYHDRPREGLIANTMLGGDNVHRGIVLGALLGAENGVESWPAEWRAGLKRAPRTERSPWVTQTQ